MTRFAETERKKGDAAWSFLQGEKDMKCPRCQSEMQREKTSERRFKYVCPKCRYTINASKPSEDDSQYKEAYEIVMGKNG